MTNSITIYKTTSLGPSEISMHFAIEGRKNCEALRRMMQCPRLGALKLQAKRKNKPGGKAIRVPRRGIYRKPYARALQPNVPVKPGREATSA